MRVRTRPLPSAAVLQCTSPAHDAICPEVKGVVGSQDYYMYSIAVSLLPPPPSLPPLSPTQYLRGGNRTYSNTLVLFSVYTLEIL